MSDEESKQNGASDPVPSATAFLSAGNSEKSLPQHVAIIMDGNGRWAKARGLKNSAGHRAGVEPIRSLIEASAQIGIRALTVFAFSSENWQRPEEEVNALMALFVESLTNEIDELHEKGVQLRLIGSRQRFDGELKERMDHCESLTKNNSRLVFTIAIDYGGRWDIAQACKEIARKTLSEEISLDQIDETMVNANISNGDIPDPDLCIRTGGEYRISNFLLWHFAYSEFVVFDKLWPDFTIQDYLSALDAYVSRQRRFGKTGDQVDEESSVKKGSRNGN